MSTTLSPVDSAPFRVEARPPAKLPNILEARLVMAAVFGLIGIALCFITFLSKEETKTFGTFLTGQIPWEGALGSVLFWKLFAGFAVGATLGRFLSHALPEGDLRKGVPFSRGVALFLLSVVVYIPAMSAGYLWDDDQEITANPSLRNAYGLFEIWTGGITNEPAPGASDPLPLKVLRPPLQWVEKTIWSDTWGPAGRPKAHESADYFPLKTTMLWLEYQLWGLSSYGYHVVNILLHAVNAIIFWLLLRQLRVPGAWLGALLFALHPAHVESVAWIAERKNTLSLLFYLLSLRAWLHFEENGRRRSYVGALAFFAASALCKTSVVMLPPVLLLLTWWRTGRMPGLTMLLEMLKNSRFDLRALWRDVARFVPFFAVALILSLITIWFQNGRAIGDEEIPIGGFLSRLAGAGLAVWWYLYKAILPINLTTIYPRWPINPPQAIQFVAGVLVVVSTWFLWAKQKSLGRTPLFVFAYFLVTLFPVLGFFKMSYMRLTLVADHFQYLSDLSIVALAGAGAAILWEYVRRTPWKPVVFSGFFLILFSAFAYSWVRAGVHHSPKTLWTDALKKNDNSWQAHNHMGAVIFSEARSRAGVNEAKMAQAMVHFKRAVELNPKNPEVHNNYGLTLAHYGRWDEALAEYREAVRIKGEVVAIRQNYISALVTTGNYNAALEQAEIMIKENPHDGGAYGLYAQILINIGNLSEARIAVEKALELNPRDKSARQMLNEIRVKQSKAGR